MNRFLLAILLLALVAACGGDGGGGGDECKPVAGACNGLDDDCDGEVDEADEIEADLAALRSGFAGAVFFDPAAECIATSGQGICAEGRAACVQGSTPEDAAVICERLGTTSRADVCNGFDDDCDGEVDDETDFASADDCGGCGLDAAGQKTVHYCARDVAGNLVEACVDGVCVESNCTNGTDDDGDGYVDCTDPDCDGERCLGTQHTCVNEGPGVGECICGLGYEICHNGVDDDCGGGIDCADAACLGQACDAARPDRNCGFAPGAARASCLERESVCGDGVDDDGDGAADCADPDCVGLGCGEGMNCDLAGACVAEEAACANGADDDGDGEADCEDTGCSGRACDAANPAKNCGSTAGVAACVDRETACGNDEDDDGDAAADCLDSDCEAKACGTGCLCDAGEKREADCGDTSFANEPVDNDHDGLANCADLGDCLGESCGTGCLCVQVGDAGFPRENRCGDLVDNDKDGLQDCQDPDCALQDCSAAGSPGCVCDPCPDGICPTGELKCEDGIDNDGDGAADCVDADCDGLRCWQTDGCLCTGGRAVEATDACDDAVDNDHDGATDCADADCDGRSCGTGCVCADLLAAEAGTHCGDGIDNDGDGLTDCADADCDEASCGAGCVCSGLARTEGPTACGDDADNDGDLVTDCSDLDCLGDACGTGCVCVADGPSGRKSETICGDRTASAGRDNDGDGLANCADPDCDGLGCGTGIAPIDVDDCQCVGTVPTERDCGNGADDDRDGQTDCVDPDCTDVAPCPYVVSVVPANGPSWPGNGNACGTGHPMQALTITGRHFGVDGAGATAPVTVRFGAAPGTACLNAVAVNSTTITCESPAMGPGKVPVTVTNGGVFAGTRADGYTFTQSNIMAFGGPAVVLCETVATNLTATAGGQVTSARARIKYVHIDGTKDTLGDEPSTVIRGEVGYGPSSSLAECHPAWTWFSSTVDLAAEPSDYDWHGGSFAAPAAGAYATTFRFTLDGVDWLYCPATTLTVN